MGRRRVESGAAEAAGTPRSGPDNPSGAKNPKEPAGRHYGPHQKAPLWLRIAALTLCSALVIGVGTAGVLFYKLQSNVTTAPLDGRLPNGNSKGSAIDDTGSLQILILGTDTRDGKNSQYGTEEDSAGQGQSDVMLLMDISADNSRVSVTSFPRDLVVPIPDCVSSAASETVYGSPAGQLNGALQAGPGCTVAAINDMTGLTIDHFMLADFTAVKELSTALGGVEVCVDHAMYDDNGSFLRLPEGNSLVEGEQALAFLRTRHAFGESGDLDRIKAQQYFLGSMVRKVKSEGTLTNLPRLYTLADVVTKNLTIDENLASIPSMISIATRLAKIDLAKVSFVTVPTEPYVADNNRVQLQQPQASQFFAALRHDTDLTASPTPTSSPTGSTSSSSPSAETPAASQSPEAPAYEKALQPISVVNATAIVGRSIELVQALAADGFSNAWQAGDVPAVSETQLLYGADMADVAADLATKFKLPPAAVQFDATVTGISLVVGADWVSGQEYGTIVVPENIVASTAEEDAGCMTVNPLYYTY